MMLELPVTATFRLYLEPAVVRDDPDGFPHFRWHECILTVGNERREVTIRDALSPAAYVSQLFRRTIPRVSQVEIARARTIDGRHRWCHQLVDGLFSSASLQ